MGWVGSQGGDENGQQAVPHGATFARTLHQNRPSSEGCTCTGSTVSLTTHRMSKREMMGSVRSTFSEKVSEGS